MREQYLKIQHLELKEVVSVSKFLVWVFSIYSLVFASKQNITKTNQVQNLFLTELKERGGRPAGISFVLINIQRKRKDREERLRPGHHLFIIRFQGRGKSGKERQCPQQQNEPGQLAHTISASAIHTSLWKFIIFRAN